MCVSALGIYLMDEPFGAHVHMWVRVIHLGMYMSLNVGLLFRRKDSHQVDVQSWGTLDVGILLVRTCGLD